MADPRTPSPDEVRALVRRIVDQTLDATSTGTPGTTGTTAPNAGTADSDGWSRRGGHRR